MTRFTVDSKGVTEDALTEYVYRVVDKGGHWVGIGVDNPRGYKDAGTARRHATRLSNSANRWGPNVGPETAPYRVQRSRVVWEDA